MKNLNERERNNYIFKTLVKINMLVVAFIILLVIFLIAYKIYKHNNTFRQETKEASVQPKENVVTDKNINNEEQEKPLENISAKLTDWNLILVNKNNKVPEDYKVTLKEIEYGHKVDERIYENLKNMLSDARNEGLDPIICSSYRTYGKQVNLYNDKVKEYIRNGYGENEAKEKASFWVAIPGTGEHETGLAVDIVSNKYQVLDEEQEETNVQKWLIENSYKYGFILRYPTSKKDITMINYEPWHYRYVGIDNAKIINEKGICLEEYIEYLKYLWLHH